MSDGFLLNALGVKPVFKPVPNWQFLCRKMKKDSDTLLSNWKSVFDVDGAIRYALKKICQLDSKRINMYLAVI